MTIHGQHPLVDVLAEWGTHEGLGRLQLPPETFAGERGPLNGVQITLMARAPLVWRILAGQPIGSFRVQIAPEDLPVLQLADRRTAEEWATAVLQEPTREGQEVRARANSPQPVCGPLVCTATGQIVANGRLDLNLPIVLFDGWHRAAAWIGQLRRGARYSISGYLVVTQHEVPLLDA